MNDSELKLRNAPIVEAVLDIGCDMPPDFDLAALEGPSRDRFRDQYPEVQDAADPGDEDRSETRCDTSNVR